MKIIEGFKLRQLGTDYVVVAESMELVNFNKMLSLNSSAAYLWESVEGKDFSEEDLANLLLERYDVSKEVALADSKSIAKAWLEAGVIAQ